MQHHHQGRLAFVLPWMGGGGAERLTASLLQGLAAKGYELDLVLTSEGGNFMELVPPGTHVEIFGCGRLRQSIGSLRDYMRRRRPAAVIVSLWPLTAATVIARFGLRNGPRLVLTDHNHLSSQYGKRRNAWPMVRATLRWLYPRAEGLVGVSDGVSDDLARIAGLPRDRVTTIYNPIPAPRRIDYPRAETDPLWQGKPGKRVIAVGRFKAQKNHPLLLRAFARMVADGEEAVLALLGEGELEADLRAMVASLGISDKVLMPGYVVDPSPWYASADLFVLSSNYEGFGNVLVEAMHFGLPVVSTDCESGPAEVLAGGEFGTLVAVGDDVALAKGMIAALAQPVDRERLRARAAEFSVERAMARYLALALPGSTASDGPA